MDVRQRSDTGRYHVTMKEQKQNEKTGSWRSIQTLLPLLTAGLMIACLVLYTLLYLNHLMHSDMAAEVILSKLLRDRGELISKEWFYSTEIRILYSHLVMTPLFYIFSDFHTVKVLSIFIFLVLLLLAFHFFAKKLELSLPARLLAAALLLAPWSNEYLDMMFLGNFYTSQTICMYLYLGFALSCAGWFALGGRDISKVVNGRLMLRFVLLAVFSLLLGLSGLRYPACLFAPMVLALFTNVIRQIVQTDSSSESDEESDDQRLKKQSLLQVNLYPLLEQCFLTVFAFAGFLINKFYLSTHYSFDNTSAVRFVPFADVPGRFLKAFQLMAQLVGFRDDVPVMSRLWLAGVLKVIFLIVLVLMTLYLLIQSRALLSPVQQLLGYYFIFHFLINFFMLVFTDVLQQYRYWIPVYIIGVFFAGIFMDKVVFRSGLLRNLLPAFLLITALSSLYSELWQDVKFNDCEKRVGYMDFLEKEGYNFGYATFWNGPVTEYLSNGKIHVGDFTGDEQGNIVPYEWLTQKDYYREGYHTGKTFLLLARTEEAGMLKGEYTVMDDAKKVYEDEYYAVYEGEGMYLFSK
ncbi:MAG: hypothetical protein IKR58_05830 [Lachnospiraceae bacterium]|nr:hypothetical protein [Lachnospiraceae bacterium]